MTDLRANEVLRFGRFELHPAKRKLLIDGETAAVGARAFDVLSALVERRERVVPKTELLDVVWPDVVVEENNLAVQVTTLRKLLGPNAIATIPGRGYRFTLHAEGSAPAPTASPSTSTATAHHPGNLPQEAPPLIGRDTALRELLARIDAHRLVTVVGAGGVGKTSLALAAAVAGAGRFRDGAWWVELATLADPAEVPYAVARALRITLADNGDAQQHLCGVLGSQQMLVVLDNCEHLIDAASPLAEAIVAAAPGVRVLATSQELLNVRGENVFRLDPLSLPNAGEAPAVAAHAAVALFVDRARSADPRFALTADNAEAVADICRRLDGLPLAIELAAARVRLLGVHGLRDRLRDRFKLLTGGARTALRRHQTLQATIEWSHALLGTDEQTVLRRLGVFVGGFSLELAQQVCADERLAEWEVLDALGTLVDKSLVSVDAGEPLRYRLLETTRAYALERLGDAGETQRLLQRHAHAVRDLFVRTDDERFGDGGTLDMASLLRRLVPELDNWRAALDWATGDGAEPTTAIALAGTGATVLRTLGLTREAIDRMLPLREAALREGESLHAAGFWLRLMLVGSIGQLPRDALIDAASRPAAMYRALGARRRELVASCYAARSLSNAGELDAAEAMLPAQASIEALKGPAWLTSLMLGSRGNIHIVQRRFDEAASLLAQARTLMLHAPGEEEGLAVCEHNLSLALSCLQRHEEVIAIAGVALRRRAGAEAHLYARLLHSQDALGRFDDAWRTLREALPVWRRDARLMVTGPLVGSLFAAAGHHAEAVRLDAAALAYIRRSGVLMMMTPQQLSRSRLFAALAAAGVAPHDIERWQREGEAMDEAQVAALCEAAVLLSGQG